MESARDTSVAGDTFAKLLRGHAAARGRRPAFRHKDLGLWRTWTWSEVYDETRAFLGMAGQEILDAIGHSGILHDAA